MSETSSVTSVAVYGAGPSVRSRMQIMVFRGLIYVEIEDAESGKNRRTAKIVLSPDRMVLMGETLAAIGNGADLDDIRKGGFSSVTLSAK